jgi:signal transduction histidine kinase
VRVIEVSNVVRTEVEDTGPGVPAGLEQSIFEPYVRGPDSGTAGLGLGLATVKKLAEGHGGSVGVVNVSAGGALFWFTLPSGGHELREAEPEEPSEPTAPHASA